jgi:hypothetical protein
VRKMGCLKEKAELERQLSSGALGAYAKPWVPFPALGKIKGKTGPRKDLLSQERPVFLQMQMEDGKGRCSREPGS